MSDFLEDSQFLAELKRSPPDNPIMFAGWSGCVSWASRKPECIVGFRTDTGAISFNRDDRETMLAFTDWVTLNIWGE